MPCDSPLMKAIAAASGWQDNVFSPANKNARILRRVMTRRERFDPHHVPQRHSVDQGASPKAVIT